MIVMLKLLRILLAVAIVSVRGEGRSNSNTNNNIYNDDNERMGNGISDSIN